MKRIFIATEINIEKELIEKIENFKNKCNKYFKINWVKEQNVHLTLKFIGEVSDEEVIKITNKMDKEIPNINSFEYNFSKFGIFGSKYNPKVVWLGLNNEEKFSEIHTKINNILSKYKNREQENFVPHITIGRIKEIKDNKLFHHFFEEMKTYNFEQNGNKKINEIKIIESILTKEGPIYNSVKNYLLD